MPRERSPRAHRDALKAAFELFANNGIDRTSMDAISETARVSKATLYKHWANKEALLLEVLGYVSGVHEHPSFDSGNTRADLLAVLSYRPPRRSARMQHRVMPHLIAYSAHNPRFGSRLRMMVMEPPRRELTRILARGIAKRELRANLDTNVALALLQGPLLYAKIFARPTARLPRDFAAQVVDAFWRAYALEGSERSK